MIEPAKIDRAASDPHFAALKHQVITATGLSYYEDKERELAAGLLRALRGKPWRGASALMLELSKPESDLFDRVAEELTIGETFFFRHTAMFEALESTVFPEIHGRKRAEKSVRIWSAGCSIGAEPYSVSILLKTSLAHLFHDWRVEIAGTDINRRFLQLARAAVFDPWALRGLTDEQKSRAFRKEDKRWALLPQFKEHVWFQQHNLVRDRFPSLTNQLFGFDVVICRNVMIYFDQATIRRLAEQFHQSLLPGGWLVVGHAEPQTEAFRAFQAINAPGAVLYHRAVAGASPVIPPAPPASQVPGTAARFPAAEAPRMPAVAQKISPEPARPRAPARREKSPALNAVEAVRRLADSGNFAEAREACERLLAEDHLNAHLHLLDALLLEQLGENQAAYEALRRAVYLDRNAALAHFHLGVVAQRLGRRAEAERAWRNAAALAAKLPEDHLLPEGDGLTAADLLSLIEQHSWTRHE